LEEALARGGYVGMDDRAVLALTPVALALALGTLAIIVVQP
jgi:hypothetical protein